MFRVIIISAKWGGEPPMNALCTSSSSLYWIRARISSQCIFYFLNVSILKSVNILNFKSSKSLYVTERCSRKILILFLALQDNSKSDYYSNFNLQVKHRHIFSQSAFYVFDTTCYIVIDISHFFTNWIADSLEI